MEIDVEIMVPIKYLSNFWRTLEMSVTSFKINIFLTWSENRCIVAGTIAYQVPAFEITDTKLYAPVATLTIQNNVKLLKKLNLIFKRRSSWKKYQSKATMQTRNEYLDYLIDPSFHGFNKQYFLPTLETKDYNVMIDG